MCGDVRFSKCFLRTLLTGSHCRQDVMLVLLPTFCVTSWTCGPKLRVLSSLTSTSVGVRLNGTVRSESVLPIHIKASWRVSCFTFWQVQSYFILPAPTCFMVDCVLSGLNSLVLVMFGSPDRQIVYEQCMVSWSPWRVGTVVGQWQSPEGLLVRSKNSYSSCYWKTLACRLVGKEANHLTNFSGRPLSASRISNCCLQTVSKLLEVKQDHQRFFKFLALEAVANSLRDF